MSSNNNHHYVSTTKLLFLLSLISPTVFSYSVTASFPHGSNAKPFGVQDFPSVKVKNTSPEVSKAHHQHQQQQTSQKYDLGIGKNQPLYGGKRKQRQQQEPTVEFLVEHEVVNTLPSPLDNDLEQLQQQQQPQSSSTSTQKEEPNKKTKRVLPKVIHVRKSQDILDIHHHSQNQLPHMTTKKTTQSDNKKAQKPKMDINTAWVEMLIHTQIHPTQQKQIA